MAKLSSIQNNNHRRKLVASRKDSRAALKKKLIDRSLSFDERITLVHKLSEMPRNSSATRVRNRCLLTGRARGFYRKFHMSRIMLRELGGAGMIPGLVKASW